MTQSKKQSVALSSVFASVFLTLLKLSAGILTGSMGILSEAAHSALDFGAAALTYAAVRVSAQPPDTEHPYGHGKVESVSALIETGLLFLTSAWIVYEAAKRLFVHRVEVEVAWYSFAVIIVAILVDFSRSRALSRVAKETNSQALEADALHFGSDILSSLVVLLGLFFVRAGINKADALAALGVSVFVLRAGYHLGKRTIDVLMDASPAELTEKILAAAKKVEGVAGVERLRVRPVGASVFVDMVVTVSRKLPLEKVHSITGAIEKRVRGIVPETDIVVHTKPQAMSTETVMEQIQVVAANHNLSVHHIAVHTEGEKKYVSFDLEVDEGLSIKQAHEVADRLEAAIREEIGDDAEINTHIDPLKPEIIRGDTVEGEERKEIEEGIKCVAENISLVKDVHNIQMSKVGGKIFLSAHCLFEDDTPLEDAHNAATRLESLILDAFPQTQRVVVHAEPLGRDGDEAVKKT